LVTQAGEIVNARVLEFFGLKAGVGTSADTAR
jgi:hypothetical protein